MDKIQQTVLLSKYRPYCKAMAIRPNTFVESQTCESIRFKKNSFTPFLSSKAAFETLDH